MARHLCGVGPSSLYLLPGGGQTGPGGVDITAGLGTGRRVSFNAVQIKWDFFKQYHLP